MAVRQFKRPRVKRVKAPQPIPPPKPPRPRRTLLRHIYKDLITSNRDQRIECLKKACHWYEELQAYMSYDSEWTLTQLKAKSEAERHRLSALNSDKSEKKEIEFNAALHQYERMMRRYHPPKVGSYLSKYSRKRSELMHRKHKLYRKFDDFLKLVNRALLPKNFDETRITLHVDKLKGDYTIDSEGNVTFDRRFLDKARHTCRHDGLLPGLLLLYPVLTKAAATVMEKDEDGHRTGRYVVHDSRRYKAYDTMMNALVKYSMNGSSKSLVIRD